MYLLSVLNFAKIFQQYKSNVYYNQLNIKSFYWNMIRFLFKPLEISLFKKKIKCKSKFFRDTYGIMFKNTKN